MPGSVSLTGSDVIVIDSRVFNDLADQDAVTLEFAEDLAKVKASKNGNTIYALNELGRVATVTVRTLLGSADDVFLNSRLAAMKADFSSFILMQGAFIKRVGSGDGTTKNVIYQCTGGIFKKIPMAKTSAEGDAEQSVSIWALEFGNGDRSVQ